MTNKIGDGDVNFLFEDNTFSPRKNKNRKVDAKLSALYDSIEINVPKKGTVIPSVYVGKTNEKTT